MKVAADLGLIADADDRNDNNSTTHNTTQHNPGHFSFVRQEPLTDGASFGFFFCVWALSFFYWGRGMSLESTTAQSNSNIAAAPTTTIVHNQLYNTTTGRTLSHTYRLLAAACSERATSRRSERYITRSHGPRAAAKQNTAQNNAKYGWQQQQHQQNVTKYDATVW